MAVWVQLKQSVHLSIHGKAREYHPGDWVPVGKSTAQQWVAEGRAIMPFPQTGNVEEPAGTAGIMVWGQVSNLDATGIPVSFDGQYELRWEKTMFWKPDAPLTRHLIPVGFSLLDRWQIAVPLYDYRVLARDDPDSDDAAKEETRQVIRDLRVPMYDTRLMFVKRCEATRRLMELWDNAGYTRLAFVRCLYQVKPLVLALPCTWTGQWAPH